jgi:hypothetical protein
VVLPIPIGTHWRDVMPIALPGMESQAELPRTLPRGMPVRPRPQQPKVTTAQKLQITRSQSKHLKGLGGQVRREQSTRRAAGGRGDGAVA